MIRYRIKTEQEFIDEFGEDWRWRTGCRWNIQGIMDYLFGMEINNYKPNEDYYIHWVDNPDDFYFEWSISHDMIKKITINYNVKKVLVYD